MILEPFAGPGGTSTGLALAGRTDTIGIELDPDACHTAAAAGHARIRADVATSPLDHLAGRVEGLAISPPCTPWSKAGKRLGLLDQPRILDHFDTVTAAGGWVDPGGEGWADPRSRLTLEPVRWVNAVRPAWVVCEQVPDVLPLWERTAAWLRSVGYAAVCGVLSAERFGVPQTRQRAFLVAARDGRPVRLPAPSHARYVPGRRLDEPADGLFDPPARERAVPPSDRGLLPWVSMADALGWDVDRPARTVCGHRRPRWAYGAGQSYGTGWALAERQANDAHGWEIRSSSRTKVNDRTRPRDADEPSMTVAFGHSDMRWFPRGSDDAHQDTVRLSIGQAAVLQSFPPDYPWHGTKSARFQQVGNAVPPLLMAAVAGELLGVDWRARLWGHDAAEVAG